MSKFGTTIVFNHYVDLADKKIVLIRAGMTKIMNEAKADAKSLVAVDTSTLQKSIYYRHIEQAVYEMYTNVEYAIYQEFGTVKMNPHPFFFPAANNARAKVDAMVGAVLAQGF